MGRSYFVKNTSLLAMLCILLGIAACLMAPTVCYSADHVITLQNPSTGTEEQRATADTGNIRAAIAQAADWNSKNPLDQSIIEFQSGEYVLKPYPHDTTEIWPSIFFISERMTLQGATSGPQTTLRVMNNPNRTNPNSRTKMPSIFNSTADARFDSFRMYNLIIDENSENNLPSLVRFYTPDDVTGLALYKWPPAAPAPFCFFEEGNRRIGVCLDSLAGGTDVIIENCEFKNFASGWILYFPTCVLWGHTDPVRSSNITVRNCDFIDTGLNEAFVRWDETEEYETGKWRIKTPPPAWVHRPHLVDDPLLDYVFCDHSSIYTGATHVEIDHCNFAGKPRTPGVLYSREYTMNASALEMHGDQQLVHDCTVDHMTNGVNAVADNQCGGAQRQSYLRNTFNNVSRGFNLQSHAGLQSAPDYPGYMADLEIRENIVRIATGMYGCSSYEEPAQSALTAGGIGMFQGAGRPGAGAGSSAFGDLTGNNQGDGVDIIDNYFEFLPNPLTGEAAILAGDAFTLYDNPYETDTNKIWEFHRGDQYASGIALSYWGEEGSDKGFFRNVTIAGNAVINAPSNGIRIESVIDKCDIYNNSLWNCGASPLHLWHQEWFLNGQRGWTAGIFVSCQYAPWPRVSYLPSDTHAPPAVMYDLYTPNVKTLGPHVSNVRIGVYESGIEPNYYYTHSDIPGTYRMRYAVGTDWEATVSNCMWNATQEVYLDCVNPTQPLASPYTASPGTVEYPHSYWSQGDPRNWFWWDRHTVDEALCKYSWEAQGPHGWIIN